jgi:hypothetical protein
MFPSNWIRNTAAAALCAFAFAVRAGASSHMDAPLITFDDAANTTDVYAFVSEADGRKFLSTALAVYPFEEPGIGPNKYAFDDEVLYEIHVSLGSDVAKGRPTVSYQFEFDTRFRDPGTILQMFTGVVGVSDDPANPYPNLNFAQAYEVRRFDRRTRRIERLGRGIVPPNNQGNATPLYNRAGDGEQPALDGVARFGDQDPYTLRAIARLANGHVAFAGQRDDGFYADIQAVFDLLRLRSGASSFDSQGGYNVHTIALSIPVDELGGDGQQVGVYATTSRRKLTLRPGSRNEVSFGPWIQVGRQGNPLFCEGLVALADKDLYSRSSPAIDAKVFRKYAERPELARLINALLGANAISEDRSDLVGIFIPDLIRVDLSTARARLAGGGADHASNPDDAGFHRLGIFGGDVLTSRISAGFGGGVIPGGWPNGRRFGDDVVDIAVSAILSDLRQAGQVPIDQLPITVADGIDNVGANDAVYNRVFPYAAPPLNGRNHGHH